MRRSLRATLRSIASPPPDNFLTSEESFMDAWKDIEEVCISMFFVPFRGS